ncbi:GNAT family N-acetyltransferase [Lentzea albidocapillata]|uniref:L-amino acid N-acyltransferase YncA n=1 Tax=Lentzea albidocapillata TaxID=40571 RepID=A0A1W2B9B6_9PSEU|nr:GNAT family N-acetyltransferase [Lentzea albidocapillata]SMC69380.1 L-amino acid N-acyltransferase YncA [Lentzea albidocapillata]
MIRRVEPRDIDAVVGLVHELALYEKAPELCHLTAEQLHTALFNESPALFGHVAEVDGQVAGIALWFLNFSTWDGVHGIYLEDLYVTPDQRGNGLGKQLLEALAQECVAKGYTRLQWWVLNWNEPSIGFYKSLGAVPMDEWTTMRVADEALVKLGSAR